ncbi:MAG: hypothetical protein ACE5J9_03140 [Methanosarcinales archaeon]
MDPKKKLIIYIVVLIIVLLPFIAYTGLNKMDKSFMGAKNATNMYISAGVESIVGLLNLPEDLGSIEIRQYNISSYQIGPYKIELGTSRAAIVSSILILGMIVTAILSLLIVKTSIKIITDKIREKNV